MFLAARSRWTSLVPSLYSDKYAIPSDIWWHQESNCFELSWSLRLRTYRNASPRGKNSVISFGGWVWQTATNLTRFSWSQHAMVNASSNIDAFDSVKVLIATLNLMVPADGSSESFGAFQFPRCTVPNAPVPSSKTFHYSLVSKFYTVRSTQILFKESSGMKFCPFKNSL